MNEDTHWMSYLNRFTSVSIIIGSAFFVSKFNNDIDKGNESLNQHVEKLKSLDNIIENLIEGAQVIGYDWKYLYANNSLCKQVNLSKNDLMGKTMMEMYPGIENSNLFNELKASMEDRKPKILLNEFEFPNGDVEYFELNIQPVDEGLFILSLVITDRVKIENQRLKYIQNLEEMLQMTSHQIRQPITNILGLTKLMKIGPNLSEEEKTQINYIKDSAIKLDEFTYNLNDFIVNSIKHNEVKLNREILTSA